MIAAIIEGAGENTGAGSPREKNGVVYTKKWVVELILDLAGYTVDSDLASTLAVEPAAGDGAFLVEMARRLVTSCQQRGRPLSDCRGCLVAYELDEMSAELARGAVVQALASEDVPALVARELSEGWVRTGDYLLDASSLPSADYVVGNPPYIRLEDIATSVAARYRRLYRAMTGRADLYVAFYQAALQQLKPGGVCAFICADRWMLNQYGAELRRLVTQHFGVEAVIEMHHADPFEHQVSAYPAITVIRRDKQGPAVVASAGSEFERVATSMLASSLRAIRVNGDQRADVVVRRADGNIDVIECKATRTEAWFKGADPWPCVSPSRLTLLTKLEAEFQPLQSEGTATRVGIGVATGADDIFITTGDPNSLEALVEWDRMLPLAMAYDAQGSNLNWSRHYLVSPWEKNGGLVDLARYPRLAAYYVRHEERLRARSIGKRNPRAWYRTIDRVDYSLVGKDKLYIADIKDRIHPFIDRGETYPHHNLYWVQSESWDMDVLGGLLLSDVAQFFIECYAVRMRGGWLRFQAQYLRRIRVPRPHDVPRPQALALANAFRSGDREEATRTALAVYGIKELPRDEYGRH